MGDRVCDHCGRWIEENEILFRMTISIQAEAKPIVIEDLDGAEIEKEFQELLETMESMTPEEAEDAIDEVHVSQHFQLCPECRHVVHDRMKRRRILESD